ncbi:MAG: CvpA family protein [Spirochaetes bacterium]|nr:CvpA family protein [Spirochaetota bacterium]
MSNFHISPVDVVFIIIILFFTIRAISRGFVTEFLSIASVLGGIIAGFVFSSILTNYIAKYFEITWWNRLISFLVIFLITYVLLKLIERFLYTLIEKIQLQRLDRSLGLFLGVLEGCIIILFIIIVIDAQPFFSSDKIFSDSIIVEYARKIISSIPENSIINQIDFSMGI